MSLFLFSCVLGRATDTKTELIRKVRSGRQDGWDVLLYPDDKQGLCHAAGLFYQTAVQNAQTLAYSCHFREKKKVAQSFICAEWRQRLGRLHIVEPHVPSCSQGSSPGLGIPLCGSLHPIMEDF